MNKIKGWITELTDITVALLALGVVAGIVFGGEVAFLDSVLTQLIEVVNKLGENGVVGIIVLAILSGMYGSRGM